MAWFRDVEDEILIREPVVLVRNSVLYIGGNVKGLKREKKFPCVSFKKREKGTRTRYYTYSHIYNKTIGSVIDI